MEAINKNFINNTYEMFREVTHTRKLILFGCGREANVAFDRFLNGLKVDYFIDNDASRWYTKFREYEILPPIFLQNEDMENVVILISRQRIFGAEEQLLKLGVKYYFASVAFIDMNLDKGDFLIIL